MKSLIPLTVVFAKDQTRSELINIDKVYRIIEKHDSSLICFNSSGSDHIVVIETKSEIEKLLN